MSIPVDLADLPKALAGFGRGYLLTSSEGRVKAVSVRVSAVDDTLRVAAPGRGSVANVGVNPAVTLLFSPPEPGGLTLLVDGAAVVDGDDVRVTPAHAIMHRAAA